ncbi:MAG: histidine kinase [Clostridia bacterium]|nr:histidine kinase [Clostridia bacterium]
MKKKDIAFQIFNKKTLSVVGVILIILSAVILLWQGNKNSKQAVSVSPAQVFFAGEYKIGNGEWKEIVSGEHIPSTKGDVTLRGKFHMLTPDGEYIGEYSGSTPIAFYTEHISLTIYSESGYAYVIDHENPQIGESACGVDWTAISFAKRESPIVMLVHNPHDFGNENAIDKMLSNIAFWGNIEFEKSVLDIGETQRNVGLVFMIASIMFLGTALFASLIHLKNSKIIWLLGLVIFFAGANFIYKSEGISFWSESVVSNTIILGVSMMFYALFLTALITKLLKRTKKIGVITSVSLGAVNVATIVLAMVTKVYFYDTWLYWSIIQTVANVTLIACLIREIIYSKGRDKIFFAVALLPLVAFIIDFVATWFGIWENGLISRFAFVILFIISMVVLLRIIPSSINAFAKAKELETEKLILNTQLAESRVSTMMSQIRPHFIYNTLGSIEQLCELDPKKAGELVHNFAKYLRGNFGELDNPKPILMSQEMEHVHYYLNIENVRFPDMTFSFEMNSNDFKIPALTIQPIVENAVKHGLMKLSKGGKIKVVSYETEDSYCVLVEDDGAGFDTSVLLDERKHVGIRNIRGRLKEMVNGTLEIESTMGVGTKVIITIPKGEEK